MSIITNCLFAVVFLCAVFISSSAEAADPQIIEITVIEKDNISNLCKKLNVLPKKCYKVISLNRLANPDIIMPGQKLKFFVKDMVGVPLDGRVSMLAGSAMVDEGSGEKWRPLNINDRVIKGSSLKTGNDGTVGIMFDDGVSLLMRPDTVISVKDSTGYGLMHTMREFFLETGRTISRLKEITGKNSRYEIRTPSAVAAARGTVFRVSSDENATMRSEVLEGSIGVRSTVREVNVTAGEGTVAKKDGTILKPRRLPEPPAVINPLSIYRTLPLRFSFSKVTDATSYRVSISRDAEGNEIIKEKIIKTDAAMQVIEIPDGAHFLNVQSIDIDGLEGRPSEPTIVRVRTNPLPPMIQLPGNEARLRERSTDLRWLKVQDAAKYHIQISEDEEFRRVIRDSADSQETVFRTGELDYKTYYFRVSSIAGDGYEGVPSMPQKFTIVPLPETPRMDAPSIDKKSIGLRWLNLGEGITYRLQVSKDAEFRNIVLDRKTDIPEAVLPKFREHGTYYVRTQGIDSEGFGGGFSLPQSFEIKRSFLYESLGILVLLGLIIAL